MNTLKLKEWLKLYFIMGSNNCTKNPAYILTEAIKGGITLFQFREKGDHCLLGEHKYALARELQSICREYKIPFIVNDDIDLALAIQADGVHIGQDDEDIQKVRNRIGNMLLGVSVHSYAEALSAMDAGADYFGLGPIFPTNTKKDAKPVQGLSFIQELRRKRIHIPIVGIGGINPQNAHLVMDAGADGVSVITAISKADSPYQAAAELKLRTNLDYQ
ncbi:thiamine-phosphate pyrophosphorylase [Peribacillus deserti]|uniref:Thiamine-phosphate synthase n=1 Tax=Peribacillus deserti TaxID=673318 RepID=A0ABS2QL84_9BACI|nr:thiamine phosphate synthase [Peribacillus deserti]MBM7693932.1 thiamine-phosphate pyrophosphorylase [Peribacillus deserti]